YVGISPVLQGSQDRLHRAPKIRKRIFHSGRHLSIDLAYDEAIFFHLTQLAREHPGSAVRGMAADFIEPKRAGQQMPHDDRLPLSIEETNGSLDGTAGSTVETGMTNLGHISILFDTI